ncbi:MAG: hypothetical protein IKW64_00875 [Clostridia bacterium]|nr:hypothetical protein [Clostridia bacterium]
MFQKENMLDTARRISIKNALANYQNCLHQYIGNQNSYLYAPKRYFYVVGDNLRCLGTNIEIGTKEISTKILLRFHEAYFGGLPFHQGLIEGIIKNLYLYLSQLEITPYYKALFNFKWQCGLFMLPFFDDIQNISVHDKRIYVGQRLLTDKFMESLVLDNKGHYVASEAAKSSLAKELLNLLDKSQTDTETDEYSVNFAEGKLSYLPAMETAKFDVNATKELSYSPYISLGSLSRTPSDNIKKSLYDMTSGSVDTLNLISEIVARMLVEKLPSKCVWSICGKGKQNFAKLLSILCDNRTSASIYEKKGQKLIESLTLDHANHSLLQINSLMVSKKHFSEINHSAVKKLMHGRKLTEKEDPFIPYTNGEYSPLITLVQYETELNEFFKNLPYQTVTLENFNLKFLTTEDISWLKLYLTANGLHIIHGERQTLHSDLALDELIHSFIHDCCDKEQGKYIETKKFGNALKSYAAAMGSDNIELLSKPTKLAKEVEEAGIPTAVLRKANNKKCFIDIDVSEEKLLKFISEKSENTSQSKDFFDFIESMTELILYESFA